VVLSELAVFSTSHVAIGRPSLFTQQFVNRAPLLLDFANWNASVQFCKYPGVVTAEQGRVMAQTLSGRPVTAGNRIRSQFGACVICGGKVAPVQVFLRVLLSSSVSTFVSVLHLQQFRMSLNNAWNRDTGMHRMWSLRHTESYINSEDGANMFLRNVSVMYLSTRCHKPEHKMPREI